MSTLGSCNHDGCEKLADASLRAEPDMKSHPRQYPESVMYRSKHAYIENMMPISLGDQDLRHSTGQVQPNASSGPKLKLLMR